MGTPFSVIYEKFIRKLKGDQDFFKYKNMTPEQVEQMVNYHKLSLLEQAIDKIYEYGMPDVDFYDKDNVLEIFNFELVHQEISLLSELMYVSYLSEDRNRLKVQGLTFRSSELNALSPANERRTFLDMLDSIESKAINAIVGYLTRDRMTWKEKSIYDGL